MAPAERSWLRSLNSVIIGGTLWFFSAEMASRVGGRDRLRLRQGRLLVETSAWLSRGTVRELGPGAITGISVDAEEQLLRLTLRDGTALDVGSRLGIALADLESVRAWLEHRLSESPIGTTEV